VTELAILGCAVRFPQTIRTLDQLWDVLISKSDQVTETPIERWNNDFFYNQNREAVGCTISRWGSYLSDIAQFDPQAFGLSPREARHMDPQQRLVLEVSLEALEDVGFKLDELSKKQVGVFFGVSTWDYATQQFSPLSMNDLDLYSATGMAFSVIANRVSYCLDLRGPSLIVDTACSSALMAVHLAARSVQTGESEIAVAGGVNCILGPGNTIAFSKMGILSASGRCRTFSSEADGFVRGEGAGAVVLMKRERAEALGLPIYAVIEATGTNQDGQTNGLAVPSGDAQSALLASIYGKGKIEPDRLGFFEAHGTGTEVGDAIEGHSIGQISRSRSADRGELAVGSVKTNFGHLESASGILGLMKAILVCQRGIIPPNLHFTTPSRHIDFDALRLRVVQEPEPLSPDAVVGVNSFGFGGANVHVALRALGAQRRPVSPPITVAPSEAEVLPPAALGLSAVSAAHLVRAVQDCAEFLAAPEADLMQVAAAYGSKRSERRFRMGFVAADKGDLLAQMQQVLADFGEGKGPLVELAPTSAQKKEPVFVFTGQGSQAMGMGDELRRLYPRFRETFARCDVICQAETGFSLLQGAGVEADPEAISRTSLAQPSITAFQISLTDLLIHEFGLKPGAVIGHSVGEIAAAHCVGIFSLEDAMRLSARRGRLVEEHAEPGKMLVASADIARLTTVMAAHPDVEISAYNSPQTFTLGGREEAIAELRKSLKAERIAFVEMEMPYAFHTALIDGCEPHFPAIFRGLSILTPQIPFYSTVTGQIETQFDEAYWWSNARKPVRYSEAVQQAAHGGFGAMIEISPNPTLIRQTENTLASIQAENKVLPLLSKQDEAAAMLRTLLHLWASENMISLGRIAPPAELGKLQPLPAFPWQRQHLWSETYESQTYRTQKRSSVLLGRRVPGSTPSWLSLIDVHIFPTLADHIFNGAPLFPGTGFFELVYAAASKVMEPGTFSITNFEILSGIFLGPNQKAIHFLTEYNNHDNSVTISSRIDPNSNTWTKNCRATLSNTRPSQGDVAWAAAQHVMAHSDHHFHGDVIYKIGTLSQIHYGENLRLVKKGWCNRKEVVAVVECKNEDFLNGYHYHPALIDSCLHSANMNRHHLFGIDATHFTFVPMKFSRANFIRPLEKKKYYAYVRKVHDSLKYTIGDFYLFDEDGNLMLEIFDFECVGLEIANERVEVNFDKFSYCLEWLESEAI
jgi:acyl transferase domain-containing protein